MRSMLLVLAAVVASPSQSEMPVSREDALASYNECVDKFDSLPFAEQDAWREKGAAARDKFEAEYMEKEEGIPVWMLPQFQGHNFMCRSEYLVLDKVLAQD